MKKWTSWLSFLLILTLLTACGSDAAGYVKDHYPLVNVEGNGANLSKVYSVEGKSVPDVTAELAAKESPKEKSKDSPDQMFLVYNNKMIDIHKDPKNNNDTLVQVETIEYAKSHNDSSFLQGYLTAAVLQSIFSGGMSNNRNYNDSRPTPRPPVSNPGNGAATSPKPDTSKSNSPTTSNRTGGFNTGAGSSNTNGGSSTRKNDGSTQNRISPPSGSKPSTSNRSGSFSKRK